MLRRLYEETPAQGQPGRPVGVAVIAVLSAISALLAAYYGLGALLALVSGTSSALVQLLLGVALTGFLLAIGGGLWRLKRWAQRLAAASLVVAVIVIAVDALARYGFGDGLSTAFSLILSRSIAPLGMAFYLVHPSISKVFSKQ